MLRISEGYYNFKYRLIAFRCSLLVKKLFARNIKCLRRIASRKVIKAKVRIPKDRFRRLLNGYRKELESFIPEFESLHKQLFARTNKQYLKHLDCSPASDLQGALIKKVFKDTVKIILSPEDILILKSWDLSSEVLRKFLEFCIMNKLTIVNLGLDKNELLNMFLLTGRNLDNNASNRDLSGEFRTFFPSDAILDRNNGQLKEIANSAYILGAIINKQSNELVFQFLGRVNTSEPAKILGKLASDKLMGSFDIFFSKFNQLVIGNRT